MTEPDVAGGPVEDTGPGPGTSPPADPSPAVDPGKVVAADEVDTNLAAKVSAATVVSESTNAITPAQLDKLVALKKQFNIQKAEWDKTLDKMFNATTARTLTTEQADELINYLEKVRVPF